MVCETEPTALACWMRVSLPVCMARKARLTEIAARPAVHDIGPTCLPVTANDEMVLDPLLATAAPADIDGSLVSWLGPAKWAVLGLVLPETAS